MCCTGRRYYLDDHNEFQYAEAVLAECVFHRRRSALDILLCVWRDLVKIAPDLRGRF